MRSLPNVLVVASTLLPVAALAQPVTVDTLNSPYVISGDTTIDSLTVATGGILTLNAPLHVLGDASVASGGLVTHDAEQVDPELDVGGTLTVALGGAIDVDGKGWQRTRHWDAVAASVVATPFKMGGSHGGRGADAGSLARYGDESDPVLLGSGGGNGDYGRTGGHGGGRIVISALSLVVNGVLSADGDGASSTECDWGGGGGAGGSILLNVGALSGSGSIHAIGGSARRGGGGGRVAVFHDGNSFTGAISAAGGTSPCGAPGGLGSTHLESGTGALALAIGYSEIGTSDSYASVQVTSGSTLRVLGPGAVAAPVVVAGGARVDLSVTTALSNLSLDPVIAGTLAINVPITFTASMTINGTLELNDRLTVGGNVTFPSGGLATHALQDDDGVLDATGTVTFQLGSSFNADGKGLASAIHWDATSGSTLGTPFKMGGSHGGRGADSSGAALSTYGDPKDPVLLGSGGGAGDYGRTGGAGGGRIAIEAASLVVNGVLTAAGASASTQECDYGGGGGSGGSIRLDVGSLSGSGSIRARGGAASRSGGGGRVAIFHTTSTFPAASVSTDPGGTSCGRVGEAGTVHIEGPGGALVVGDGALDIGDGDSYASVVLSAGSLLRINGAAAVTAPIDPVAGARVEVRASSAFAALTIDPVIEGAVAVYAPISWPASLTVPGILEVNEHLTVQGSVTVPSGGLVTHQAQVGASKLEATGTVDFQLGSFFNVDGKGFAGAAHWDPVNATLVTTPFKMGGSHGGKGAEASGALDTYGAPESPTLLGSGGGNGDYGRAGGAGGGRIYIEAPSLVVNGTLTAGGASASSQECDYGGGGGAGGSILLDVGALSGSAGTIRARGGAASRSGGGGRIAIFHTSNTFAGLMSAVAGTSSCGRVGSAGTTRVQGPGGALSVGDGAVDLNGSDSYASVTLSTGSILRIQGAATVTAPIDVVAGARVEVLSSAAFDNLGLVPDVAGTVAVYAPIDWSADLAISGVLELNDRLTVNGDVAFLAGGAATHAPSDINGALVATGTVDFHVASSFNVDGRGFGSAVHWSTTTASTTATPFKMGGSHGGLGADGGALPTYGDPFAPALLGSGGGGGDYGRTGGAGGGRIVISAPLLVVDGVLSANGAQASSLECNYGGGGGSGGGVWLDVDSLTGSGIIRANGGAASRAGGGGRVLAGYGASSFDGQLFVDGGTSPCSRAGEAGSLLMEEGGVDLTLRSGVVVVDESDAWDSVTVAGGSLVVDGAVGVLAPVAVTAPGELVAAASSAFDGLTGLVVSGRLEVLAPVALAGAITVGGVAVVDDRLAADALTVAPGGVVTHSPGVRSLDLAVGSLLVSASARIDAGGLGLPGAPAAGFGNAGATYHSDTLAIVAGSALQNGGSHNALGGQANAGAALATGYDDVTAPAYGGGGGGQGAGGEAGGAGGGVIRIFAGSLTVNGLVSADGLAGSGASSGGGGGAGGTVVIVAASLAGSSAGRITANGGPSSSGGGAGGIIVVEYADSTFAGAMSASGGNGAVAGADGDEQTELEPAAPAIVSTPSGSTVAGTLYSYQATAAGTSPITWSLLSGPPGADIDASTGLFTWTSSSAGVASVRIAATNLVGSAEQVFVVQVFAAPQITTTAANIGYAGFPYHYNDADAPAAGGSAPMTWSASLFPAGFSIDAATGRITWTPAAQGTYNICVDVENAAGSDQQCWQVDVVTGGGAAPEITSTPSAAAAVGQAYSYDDDATVDVTGSPPITFAALVAPDGFVVDESSGLVSWTPAEAGAFGVCLEARGAFGVDVQCFTVVVGAPPGAAPAITSTPEGFAIVAEAYRYDDDGLPSATGSAPLSWGLQLGPDDMLVDAATGEVTWTPAAEGLETVCLTVANDAGADVQCFAVDVLEDPGPPQFVSSPTVVAPVGLPYSYDEDGRAEAVGPGVISYGKAAGPLELDIDSATGAVTFTPAAAGNYDVTLTASTAFGADEQQFTLSVVPEGESGAPVILHEANLLAAVGLPYVYDKDRRVEAAGAEPLSYAKVSGPTGFTVDATTGLVHFVPQGAGPVTVVVSASNAFGGDSYEFTIEVSEEASGEPVARFTAAPESGDAPLTVSFDASASEGTEGAPIVSYGWRFGAGEPPATGVLAAHSYVTPGSRVAHLVVGNVYGVEAAATRVIRVLDDGAVPPSARILISEVQGSETLDVAFACECVAGDKAIASYQWDLGDGSVVDSPALSHSFGPGGYTVTLTVVDEAGLTATDQVFIRVSEGGNAPPLLQAGAAPTGGPAPLTVQLSALAADPDGAVASLVWTFPDDTTAEDPTPSYTFDEPGVYEVRVEAVDDLGLSSSAAVEIEVTDDGLRAPEILSVPLLEAFAGEPYAYDDDSRPAVRGSRPLRFSLGKRVGDRVEGAPAGMEVDDATGEIRWTPNDAQGGEQRVVLLVENDVGSDAQEWVVVVEGAEPPASEPPPESCGCATVESSRSAAAPAGALALAALLLRLTRRRRASPTRAPAPRG